MTRHIETSAEVTSPKRNQLYDGFYYTCRVTDFIGIKKNLPRPVDLDRECSLTPLICSKPKPTCLTWWDAESWQQS